MTIKVNRDQFANALSKACAIIGSKATLPILSNVLIEGLGDRIVITTTNLDLALRCSIKAEVSEGCRISLPARHLLKIVREMPNQEVALRSLKNYKVEITSGGSLFRIIGLDASEFPALPKINTDRSLTIEQSDLSTMLRRTMHAQSSDESRYILNAMLFCVKADQFTVVATDGRRLAIAEKTITTTEPSASFQSIIPAKTITEVDRNLGAGKNVTIGLSDKNAVFRIETSNEDSGFINEIEIFSKVVEGNYPNFRQVIPSAANYVSMKVDRDLLLSCASRAALVTSDRGNCLTLRFEDNLIKLSASSADHGEFDESIATDYSKHPISAVFTPTFIIQPLDAISFDEITLEVKDEVSPAIIKVKDFITVIMPQRKA